MNGCPVGFQWVAASTHCQLDEGHAGPHHYLVPAWVADNWDAPNYRVWADARHLWETQPWDTELLQP